MQNISMRNNLIFVLIALSNASLLFGMEPEIVPAVPAQKNFIPETIYIPSFKTLIPFRGTEKPLLQRLNNRAKNKFGDTVVALLDIARKSGVTTYKEESNIRNLDEAKMLKIAAGKAFYVTNMERKKHFSVQPDQASISYGALVFCDDIAEY